MNELKLSEVYAEDAKVKLSGHFTKLNFSSGSTKSSWHIVLEVRSSNGSSTTVEEVYKFPFSLIANSVCGQAAQAFVPAVQDLLGKLVHSPDFAKLVAP